MLIKIHSNYRWVKADVSGKLSVYGALTKGDGFISVRREDGMSVSCSVPAEATDMRLYARFLRVRI